MKYKYLLLIIIITISVILIYNHNYTKKINILSINSLNEQENYNTYLSNYLNKSNLNYNFNVDYTNDKLEIENLIALINKNKNEFQNIIHESDVILLSLGNIDIKEENYKTIINELEELFKKLRLINSKEIIFISPYKVKNTTIIKDICHKYNIYFINGSSFINKSELLAQMIYRKIESQYNIK